jgi:hypothetical protein
MSNPLMLITHTHTYIDTHTSVSTVCFGFSLFNAQLNYLNIFKVRKTKFNFDPSSFSSFLYFVFFNYYFIEGIAVHVASRGGAPMSFR